MISVRSLLVSIAALLVSCSTSYTLIDTNNKAYTLDGGAIEKNLNIKRIEGTDVSVMAKEVDSLYISHNKRYVFDNEVYLLCYILYSEDKTLDGFLNINNTFTGKSKGITVETQFKDILILTKAK